MNTVHLNCPSCGHTHSTHRFHASDWLVSKKHFEIVDCSSCGLTFTKNVPGPDYIAPYYDSPEYLSHNDKPTSIFGKIYQIAKKINTTLKTKAIIGQLQHGNVLEIGLGTGDLLHRLQANGWNVTGTELSDHARAIAQAKLNVDLYATIAECNHIKESSQDRVIMMHVLEHVYNLHETIAFSHKVLKPNGLLIVAVPNLNSADSQHYQQHWAALDVPRHLYHFTPSSLKHILSIHRFEITRQTIMPFDPFFISLISENQIKSSKLAPIYATLKATLFILQSLFNTNKSSSIIYTIRKKP